MNAFNLIPTWIYIVAIGLVSLAAFNIIVMVRSAKADPLESEDEEYPNW